MFKQRHALGCISNQTASSTLATGAATAASHLGLKQQQSFVSSSQDENSGSQQQQQLTRTKSTFDFEIFHDEQQPFGAAAAAATRRDAFKTRSVTISHPPSYDENAVGGKVLITKTDMRAAMEQELHEETEDEDVFDDDDENECNMAMDASCIESHANSVNDDSAMHFDNSHDESDWADEIDIEAEQAAEASRERAHLLASCLEYKDDIMAYLREREQSGRAKSQYLRKQADLTANMRSILVDWLVEVSEEYKLHTETLYLAVSFTDRFLSQMSVLRNKLQLVGTASIYLASKYEEITPPDVGQFVYITDNSYTAKQVLRMEHILLKVLNFKLSAPTAFVFLTHFLRFAETHEPITPSVRSLAKYIAELTLIDADTYLDHLPSCIAASALYLAMMANDLDWDDQVAASVGYTVKEMTSCISDMHATWLGAATNSLQAIRQKYNHSSYHFVSSLDVPELSLVAAPAQ